MDAKIKFQNGVNEITDLAELRLYFIKKTKSPNPGKKIYLNIVGLKNDTKHTVMKLFLDGLHQKLNDVTSGKSKLKGFIIDDNKGDDYSFLKKGEIAILDHFIENIQQIAPEKPIEDLHEMKVVKKFCVELIDGNHSIIVFSSVMYSKIDDGEEIATKMIDQKLEQIPEQIAVLSNSIDAVYLTNYELLIIFNEANTKEIFGFNEYFKNLSVDAIMDLSSLVETEKAFLEKNLTDKKMMEDIAKMYIRHGFEKTIDNYKEYDKLFKANKELDPNLTAIDITVDNKLKLDTKNKLETFVRMSKRNILQDPLDKRDLYIVYGKQSMKK